LPQPLLAIDGQGAGYGGKALLSGLKFTLMPGDRLALLGRNGAGKSTCMKLLAGELPGQGGSRTEARDLRIGYFAQHHLEQLKADESPLENLRRTGGARAKRTTEAELRDYLATFGFQGNQVFEAIAPFSGGEKARLMLALVAWQRPNLLLLDEPTNHLDLEMRQALSVALQDYPGAVVLVSHDRHLLNTVANELIVVHDGRAESFDGDLEDYAQWLANGGPLRAVAAAAAVADESSARARPGAGARPAAVAQPAASAPAPAAEGAAERKRRRRDEAARRYVLSPLRSAVQRHEAQLEKLARERAALEAELAAPELYLPAARAQLEALLARQRDLQWQSAQSEAAWLEASERLEAAT
jgi:ATP-binding cassette subfamily F protein 3